MAITDFLTNIVGSEVKKFFKKKLGNAIQEHFGDKLNTKKNIVKKTDLNPTDGPTSLLDFIGQKKAVSSLKPLIEKSKKDKSFEFPHHLIYGPPGLGKTSIVKIVSNELNLPFIETNGITLKSENDVFDVVLNLNRTTTGTGTFWFIDEIHALKPKISEILYPILQDKYVIRKGKKYDIPNVTVFGATTHPGLLKKPFRDRFPYKLQFELYSISELEQIGLNYSSSNCKRIRPDALENIVLRSRQTPRVLKDFLRQLFDIHEDITNDKVLELFNILEIDSLGLTAQDRLYISFLNNMGSVSLDSISKYLNVDKSSVLNEIEPYLIQNEWIRVTSKGRELTEKGKKV